MPSIPKVITGRLDYDTSAHLVEKGDFIAALNITREQGSGGSFNDDTVVGNVKGNRFVAFNLPLYGNKTIGAKADPLRNAIYYFIYNTDGFHTIAYYDNATRVITKIFQSKTDSNGIDILQWNPQFSIIHIDVIHRDDDGDLLYWVDPVPRKINIQDALNGQYIGSTDLELQAGSPQPKTQITAEYISDANIAINNLSGKLFEFSYRYVYADFTKSAFGSLSDNPLPGNDYDENINPLANNVINVTIDTGERDVKKIEVIFRQNEGDTWSDYYLINSFDKDELFLSDNASYTFQFTNDGAYILIPPADALELSFDFIPRYAKCQCLPNGNYLAYGAITEGYPNMTDLNVQATVTYEQVLLPEGSIVIGNPSFTFIVNNPGNDFTAVVGSIVTPGDIYHIEGTRGTSLSFSFDYTAQLGDANTDVAAYFVSQIDPIVGVSATDLGGGGFKIQYGPVPNGTLTTTATAATQNAGGNFFDRIYKFGGKFRFGMVYFDEQGRTPGVQTYVGSAGTVNDFEIEIANFNAFDIAYNRPQVNITVFHRPPSWAKSFSFVRTQNLRVQTFFMFKSDEVQDDGTFFYFGIDDLIAYQDDNPNFSSAWTFQSGDRLVANYYFNAASTTGWGALYNPVLDYEIIGSVTKDFGSGDKQYIKVRKYPGSIAPFGTYDNDTVFEVYRPALRTDESLQVYYEFGEQYPCVEIDGVNYHQGQNATTNPTFTFTDGDIYLRIRSGLGEDYLIQDPNFSDFTASAVNSNGRPFVVDENAAETYNPVLIRTSQAYQFGTNINGLNRFYYENFDEYNRDYGDIGKLDVHGSYMDVAQKFRIGTVPIFLQMVRDEQQSNLLATSGRLLNQINYYSGDFGIGNTPESWARNNFARYFCDSIRGVVCRLSQDGITPLSYLYKVNSWSTKEFPLRNGTTSKIWGVFNAEVNRYEISMELALQSGVMNVGVEVKSGIGSLYALAVNLVDICNAGTQTLYTGTLFDTGIVVYYDTQLTANVTGYNYIALEGVIYNLDSATGEVGAITGNVCGTGTGALYKLDTVLANICDNPTQTLYTNGAFGIGQILYYDSALAVPVTGYNYVADSNNDIYNLDSGTGEVLSDTGSDCGSGIGGSYRLHTDASMVCTEPVVTLYTATTFGVGVILYSDSNLTTPVTGYDYVVQQSSADIYNLNSGTGQVGSLYGSCLSGIITVYNNTAVITPVNITNIFFLTGGGNITISLPINQGLAEIGSFTNNTGVLRMTLSSSESSGNWSAVLIINSVTVECVTVTNPNGFATFSSTTFNVADSVEVELNDGSCP